MANDLSIFKDANAGPALASGISELAKAAVTSSMTRRIQTNTNGTFRRLVGGEQQGKAIRGEFNAIIVAMMPKVGRTFYAGRYDPDAKGTLPDCWSDDGVFPEARAGKVQARSCAACPNNIDGSGENGKGKACRFSRRVALMLEDDLEGHLYQFNIPAKSLFGKGSGNVHPFESYLRFLVTNNTSPDYVVTNIAYDLDADTMQMVFTPKRPITKSELALVEIAQRDPDTQRLIRITVGEADGGKPKQLTAPVAAADDDDEDEVVVPATPAPKAAANTSWLNDALDDGEDGTSTIAVEGAVAIPKRVAKKTAPTAAPMKPDLANIVSDWLDDAAEANA